VARASRPCAVPGSSTDPRTATTVPLRGTPRRGRRETASGLQHNGNGQRRRRARGRRGHNGNDRTANGNERCRSVARALLPVRRSGGRDANARRQRRTGETPVPRVGRGAGGAHAWQGQSPFGRPPGEGAVRPQAVSSTTATANGSGRAVQERHPSGGCCASSRQRRASRCRRSRRCSRGRRHRRFPSPASDRAAVGRGRGCPSLLGQGRGAAGRHGGAPEGSGGAAFGSRGASAATRAGRRSR